MIPPNKICAKCWFDSNHVIATDSRFDPTRIAAILRSYGFCAIEDINFQEIASRFGNAVQGLAPGHADVHVVHAKR